KGLFYAVVIIFIAVLNVLTLKTGILPTIYFPSPSRTIAVLVEDRELILKCLLYSSRILLIGFFGGGAVGILSGIAIGFSKHVRYWLNPLVRFIGPIPSTAWVPLVLVAFPDTVSASAFLIALAVWFPTTLMTSSGIQNISNSFFEVSETLGANLFYKIFKIAVPAAMPSIFIGVFNGTCSSFITLMTAEMIGAKYGIGWYVNWQKEMMCYANVYAGLIVIAAVCSILITLLFKLKDRLLVWQKGTIKW
ncbi:MAG: ABC transporter permease subunit, partial [Firmicutes bacterium]|nr:ABC transporter permease subunit [Bacillota bacterium]